MPDEGSCSAEYRFDPAFYERFRAWGAFYLARGVSRSRVATLAARKAGKGLLP